MTVISEEYEVQIIEAVTEDSGTIDIIVNETEFIEVIEKGPKGNTGASYEFEGGTKGQVWTVLGDNYYGWEMPTPDILSGNVSPNTIPVADETGESLKDSPFTVEEDGTVVTEGSLRAAELITSIASLNLGDQKKISGVGEGVEVHDMSHNVHKLLINQPLNMFGQSRSFHYAQQDYQLIPIQPVHDTLINNPEFAIFTSLGDQILYSFEVKVPEVQEKCVAEIYRLNDPNPIWKEEFFNVASDELQLGKPVVLDGNTNYVFKITGDFYGNAEGKMYYSIGARLAEKSFLLDERDKVEVDGTQNPSIITGEGLESRDLGENVEISLSGKTSVVEFDVNVDGMPTVDSSYAGKEISITQSGATQIMQIFFEAHNTFETGQTFHISASESYDSHLFVVYYTLANGAQRVLYPSFACSLIRTNQGWDTQTDGMLTRVAIVSDSDAVQYSDTSSDTKGIQAFVYSDHPAVEHKETDEGIKVLAIDLHKKAERNLVSFVNKDSVEVNYEQTFVSKVYLLNKENVHGHSIVVNINGESETYTTTGLFCIDEQNIWSDESSRMAFKGDVTNKYVVFDKTTNSWVLSDLGVPTLGEVINANKFQLMNNGLLPDSYGDVQIDVNVENIPTQHFSLCVPVEKYIAETRTLIISFAGTYQTGYVVL